MLGPSARRAEGPFDFWGQAMVTGGSTGPFSTLTHARLRAEQGDVAGAKRILRVILASQPEHEEARQLLAALGDRVSVTYQEPTPDAARATRPATTSELAARFKEALGGKSKVERLEQWLGRLQANREKPRVR